VELQDKHQDLARMEMFYELVAVAGRRVRSQVAVADKAQAAVAAAHFLVVMVEPVVLAQAVLAGHLRALINMVVEEEGQLELLPVDQMVALTLRVVVEQVAVPLAGMVIHPHKMAMLELDCQMGQGQVLAVVVDLAPTVA
jgi:hypothetical protein